MSLTAAPAQPRASLLAASLTPACAARLDLLADLRPGWAAPQRSLPPSTACLTAARTLLAALPAHEQDAWSLAASIDDGISAERADLDGAPNALFIVDISQQGAIALYWFDGGVEHEVVYTDAAQAAEHLLRAVADTAPHPLPAVLA